jgi:hypothetical protein
MPPPRGKDRERSKDERESREPPEGQQNREREGPGSGLEDSAPVRKEPGEEREDERVDREAAETFPASDPPANY